jgi:PAS domain S-box-containing protein
MARAAGQPPRLHFRLPLDPARLLRARERVRDYLRSLTADEDLVDDVVLCVEEACTNAIRHSGAVNGIDVSLGSRDGRLSAEVRDQGRGFDVEAWDRRHPPDPLATGGRGLFLMDRLMDELSIESGDGVCVRMVRRVPDADAGRAGIGPAGVDRAGAPVGVPHELGDPPWERVRTILDEIDEGFIAVDWEYRVIYVNEAGARVSDRRPQDAVGRTLVEVWPELAGSDLERALIDAMELGFSRVLEWCTPHRRRWLEVRLYPTQLGVSAYIRDISERKRVELAGLEAQDKLRRSEGRLRAAFEQAAVGMLQVGLDGRIQRANERAALLLRTSRDELQRLTLYDITHRDDAKKAHAAVTSLLAGLSSGLTLEQRCVRRDGGTAWVSATISLVHDHAGLPDHIVVVLEDISARKQAAEATRRYQLLSSQAREIILFIRKRDGAIVEANRAAELAYGWPREELLRRTIFDLRIEGRTPTVLRQMEEAAGEGVLFEARHRRADGTSFPAEVSSHGVIDADGEVVLLSVARDVSERHALGRELAKERDALAAMMASTPAQVAYLDAELCHVMVNEAYALDCGAEARSLIGSSLLDLDLTLEDRAFVEQAQRTGEAVERRAAPRHVAYRPERGRTYWDWRLSPVKGVGGKIEGYVLSRSDVTERVRRTLYAEGFGALLARLRRTLEPDRIAHLVAEGVAGLLEADAWSIWGYDGAGLWTMLDAHERFASLRHMSIPADEAPHAMECRRTATVVVVQDTRTHPRGSSTMSRLADLRSLLVAPLSSEGDGFSAVLFGWGEHARVFTAAEVELVTRATSMAAATMRDASHLAEVTMRERLAEALNAIGASITSLFDPDEILTRVVRLAARAIGAESASISLIEGDAWVPRHLYQVPESVRGVPIPLDKVGYARIALETRQAVAVDDCESDPRVDLDLQRAWNVQSVVVAPLVLRDEAIGGLFLNYHSRTHHFTTLEAEFAANIAALVSSSLGAAHRFESERRTAETLQQVFIHPLPTVSGLELARASGTARTPDLVGGDLSDVFELRNGRVLVLIGDVEGKGVRAAGLTETVRSGARTAALIDPSPSFVLGRVNDLLLRARPGQFVTALALTIDPATGAAAYASAGHPPALLLREGACRELVTHPGTPLGAFSCNYAEERLAVETCDILLLYTDGLVEARRGDELFGAQRAAAHACERLDGSLDALVRGLRDAAVSFGGALRDDLQILALRRTDAGSLASGRASTKRR